MKMRLRIAVDAVADPVPNDEQNEQWVKALDLDIRKYHTNQWNLKGGQLVISQIKTWQYLLQVRSCAANTTQNHQNHYIAIAQNLNVVQSMAPKRTSTMTKMTFCRRYPEASSKKMWSKS